MAYTDTFPKASLGKWRLETVCVPHHEDSLRPARPRPRRARPPPSGSRPAPLPAHAPCRAAAEPHHRPALPSLRPRRGLNSVNCSGKPEMHGHAVVRSPHFKLNECVIIS